MELCDTRRVFVFAGGSTTNIGFHIRIPFVCHFAGVYHFRMHADYGMGSFIGVDGAEHTPGNLWGHVQADNVNLVQGDHEFEALGFEDCCDGHAELEVHFPCDRPSSVWRTVHAGTTDWTSRTCFSVARCPAPSECGPEAGSAGVCGSAGSSVACGAAPANVCDIDALPVDSETALTSGVVCADDPDGILASLSPPVTCDEGLQVVQDAGGDCDTDAHTLEATIPEGTLARYICPVHCGDCVPGEADGARAALGRAGALSLGGHTALTEFGLHFDGDHDFAMLRTGAYGADTTWSYSLWFSKAECNPRAATNWEYMIAHSAAENSDRKLERQGADSDPNVHIYLGCRGPQDFGPNSFWRFKSFAHPEQLGPPSNFFRIIMADSAGSWTLSDLPLSATLEEYMMGGWNHMAFSMTADGFVVTLDGEVIPDDAYGIYGHHGYWDGNNGNPSDGTVPWSQFTGFEQSPLYLGARICSQDNCARNEWLGYLADFVVYNDALGTDCTASLYEGMVDRMPLGVPHAALEGTCSNYASLPVELSSTLAAGGDIMPTLGGQTQVTEFGLHFDGQNDWATLRTPDYGMDASWTYSIWFSKAECNPNAAWNWEYMIAHSASGNSAINMDGRTAPGGDDNAHIYLGCRPEVSDNNAWSGRNFTTNGIVPPGNMLRTILMDSAGTLADVGRIHDGRLEPFCLFDVADRLHVHCGWRGASGHRLCHLYAPRRILA